MGPIYSVAQSTYTIQKRYGGKRIYVLSPNQTGLITANDCILNCKGLKSSLHAHLHNVYSEWQYLQSPWAVRLEGHWRTYPKNGKFMFKRI